MDKAAHARLLHTCAWCNLSIPADAEVYGFGARAREDLDLAEKEGQFVSLKLALADKTVFAMVAPENSPAKEAGYDLMFITCSQECAEALKDALEFEKDVFEENL
jgi:hypothetical protein